MPVHSLSSKATDLRVQATLLNKIGKTAAETASAVGVVAANLGDVAIAVSAVALAAEASRPVADFVTPELMQASAVDVVVAAAKAIHEARARQRELEADHSISPSIDPALLRKHAAVLADSGMFGFMNPAVKAAKLAYASLLKSPRRADKSTMMAAMARIAEHVDAVAAISTHVDYRSAMGAHYRGLATDIKTALGVVAWATGVRARFSQSKPAYTAAFATLMSGSSDRLRAIRALADRPETVTLRTYYLERFPSAAASFETLAAEASEDADMIEALAGFCQHAGVPADAVAGSLPNLSAALRFTAETEKAARMPPQLAFATSAPCQAPLDDYEPFEGALRLALAVDQLRLPSGMQAALWRVTPETLRRMATAASELVSALDLAFCSWTTLKIKLGLDEHKLLCRPIGAATPTQVEARLAAAAAHSGELGGWIRYLQEREAVEALQLGDLLRLWDQRGLPYPLKSAFDRVLYHGLVRAAFLRYPELDRFTGLGQEDARAKFKSLDEEASALRRQYLADEVGQRQVPAGTSIGKRSEFTDRALIQLEISKQKRHIPLRQLLDRAGSAIQALKPCFMMGPLSVAQYLKPGRLTFDLLVIDEASQMRPEDALGAVARCSQIVVVGDPMQLPPTSFFTRGSGAEDDDDQLDEQIDAESILDLSQAVFRPMRRLRWHYRSRHGSLVAFSNREFYDDDLVVFPSPAEAGGRQGVVSVKVDGIYKARSNLAEVEAVCEAAVEHMRASPDRSLGIATMNQIQRELITEEMDRLAATHEEVEAYRKHWAGTLERFFVKNLENVQGDERDVIFVSTVFGPATPGGKPLQRFGPINGASGHRRLNVLFTRAKHHLRVFTSMEPDDIIVGPDGPRGAQVLKAYLAYAQTGRLDAGAETGREADSDFELFVCDRLRSAGYDTVLQVGVAGYFIDLAVRDPRSPAVFLLGIECDGASYHSSRSARDRDILRQQVLEGLGWTIYRIWSTDWFQDPEGQTKKLIEFVRKCSSQF